MSPSIIEQRTKALLDAHASNLIENLDMGEENLNALLELAQENISNEEFERIAMARIFARYPKNVSSQISA